MEQVMKYLTGFFGGLVSIMLSIVPVAILWQLLTGGLVFEMNIIENFVGIITSLGNSGFVGLLALVFIMYFFLCNEKCKWK
jgi:hypothetical protein|tara:strand:+ start:128 stop:370 length:243 start_codon:yes stop_codon:yes gene_type:complete